MTTPPPYPSAADLVVATDGSSHQGLGGYGYFGTGGLHGYGPSGPGDHPELTAIERALEAVPPTASLRILTDSHEAILRLRDGVAPKARNAHLGQISRLTAAVATRPGEVAFEHVAQDAVVVPPHAVAHFLAFLGRQGHQSVPGQDAPGARRILAADDPNVEAHRMVTEILFPSAARQRR